MRININMGIGSDVCGFYEIQLAIVLTTSEGKVVLKDVMLTGQRPFLLPFFPFSPETPDTQANPAKKAPFRNYLIDGTSTGTIILLETIKRKRRRNADPRAPLATVTTVFE